MDIAAKIRAKIDRDMMAMIGVTSTNAAPAEPFTLDRLREAMALLDTIPPPPVFASSAEYPQDGFWQFEREGCEYVLGHPDLWARLPASTGPLGLAAIQIVDVDDPSRGELRGKIRFWLATASHRPGEPPKWPRGVAVAPRRMR